MSKKKEVEKYCKARLFSRDRMKYAKVNVDLSGQVPEIPPCIKVDDEYFLMFSTRPLSYELINDIGVGEYL